MPALDARINSMLSQPSQEEVSAIQTRQKASEAGAVAKAKEENTTQSTKPALDTTTGQEVFATEQEIQSNPNLSPIENAPEIVIDQRAQDAATIKRTEGLVQRELDLLGRIDETAEQSASAQEGLSFLRRQLGNVETGQFAPLRQGMARIVSGLGLNPELIGVSLEEIGSGEAFATAVNEIVLQRAENMKGNLSDRDVRFLESATPRLSNTAQGNELIIDYLMAINDRNVLKQQMAEVHMDENDGSLKGFNKRWREFQRGQPFVSRECR